MRPVLPEGARSARPLPEGPAGLAVKICGLTRPADAALAARLGAAALGVVLAPSPRMVDPARAAEVLSGAPPHVARVGVFVDPDPDLVAEVVAACDLDWVQLSGREPAVRSLAIMEAARAAAPGRRAPGLLRAVHVRAAEGPERFADYPADAFLLDAPPLRGRFGGTGRTFDWASVRGLPWPRDRVALAGGLTAENLAKAVAAVRPAMVDVSSGVETAPGIKDPASLSAFLGRARHLEMEHS